MTKIRNWFIAFIVTVGVFIIFDIVQYIIQYDLTFFKGWFACSAFYYTLSRIKSIDLPTESLESKVITSLEKENEYLHDRIDELNSQITTERCMKNFK